MPLWLVHGCDQLLHRNQLLHLTEPDPLQSEGPTVGLEELLQCENPSRNQTQQVNLM